MRAIIFDLFETLVTEWGKPKYLTHDVAIDLDVDPLAFRKEWSELGRDRFLGKYRKAEQAYKAVLDRLDIERDEHFLAKIAEKRKQCKKICFGRIQQNIVDMLSALKYDGYKIGLISNCSPEEIDGLQECALHNYFDAVVLSCDVGMVKPDANIYEQCCSLLEEKAKDCLFVGDGGSDELNGANRIGMTPLRALWFIKFFVENFDDDKTYKTFHEPNEMVQYIRCAYGNA